MCLQGALSGHEHVNEVLASPNLVEFAQWQEAKPMQEMARVATVRGQSV
jgi:hypothetical protein